MAESGTLALVRSHELSDPSSTDASKDALQQRMEVARESISQTVDEIKDTVVNQYESVKESVSKTLDWHEQVKKRPVAWGAGVLGAGFVVGYGLAAVVKGPAKIAIEHHSETSPASPPATPVSPLAATAARQNVAPARLNLQARAANAEPDRAAKPEQDTPGLVQRLQETAAFDRVKEEAGVIGNKFVAEISKQAQEVLLPAAIAWIGKQLSGLLPAAETARTKAN
jgi:hypothetical protein